MVNRPGKAQLSSLPSSGVGRWSVGLAVISLLTLAFGILISVSDRDWSNIWLTLGAYLAAALAGLAGLIAALLAVLRIRERGQLVLLPILWGLVVAFALAYAVAHALANPH